MLGIIIGVCAVIVIVALGTGAKDQMTEEMFGMEENIIELYYEQFPDEDGNIMYWEEPSITSRDLAEIQSIPGVRVAMGINYGWGSINHNNKQIEMEIKGEEQEYSNGKQ